MNTLITLGGFAGSLLISIAFAMQVRPGQSKWQRAFLYANLAGSLLLIPPAVVHATTLALLLNAFWMVVTIAALIESHMGQQHRLAVPAIKITAAATVVAALWTLHHTAYSPLNAMSTAALLLFMAGYFEITRGNRQGDKAFYFGTALAGNALYIPMLYSAGNFPNLSLQVCCLIISIYGLAQTQISKAQTA